MLCYNIAITIEFGRQCIKTVAVVPFPQNTAAMQTKFRRNKVHGIEAKTGLSKFSRFFRILIALRFIPIEVDYENLQASFSFCSLRFGCHILVSYGPPIIGQALLYIVFNKEMMMLVDYVLDFVKQDIITGISILTISYLMTFFLPLMVIFLSKGIPLIPEIALSKNLKWPNHGLKTVCSFFLCFFGLSLLNVNNTRYCMELYGSPLTINLFIITMVFIFVNFYQCLNWSICITLISSWLDYFLLKCKEEQENLSLCGIDELLNTFKNFQSGSGRILFGIYFMTQLTVIFSTFLTFSNIIKTVYDMFNLTIFGLANLLLTCGVVVSVLAMTFTVEEAQDGLKELGPALQARLVMEQDKTTRRRMKNMVINISVSHLYCVLDEEC